MGADPRLDPYDAELNMNRIPQILACCLALSVAVPVMAQDTETARLVLVGDLESRSTVVETSVMKPFDVYLVAERDSDASQISTVAFTLGIPEGLLVVGEEVLVKSLIALGTPKSGLNLAFHCIEAKRVPVFRFRLVATQSVEAVKLRVLPDTRTEFRGVVSCRDENYVKWEADESSFTVTAR